jgi:hypothetical protein
MLEQCLMYPTALIGRLMCYTLLARWLHLDTVSSNILHNVSFISKYFA